MPKKKVKQKGTARFKCFIFTLNNPTITEEEQIKERADKYFKYLLFQHETGEKGTDHLQGYGNLLKQMRSSAIHKIPGFKRSSIFPRRGTVQQAINYCSKTGENGRTEGTELFEFGTPPRGGTKVQLFEAIKRGDSLKKIAEEHPKDFLVKHSGIIKMKELFQKKRADAPKVYIFYGKTGTGKSFKANDQWPNAYRAMWPKGGRWWWDHYDHEETVILDEFRHQVKYDTMLRLLDRYQMKVEYKGGVTEMNSKRIVITTNINPKKWYPNVRDRAPLIRRINEFAKIYKFWHKNEPPKVVKFKKKYVEGIPLPEVQIQANQGGWTRGPTNYTDYQ